MENFFEVKGSTKEMFCKTFLKVGVIPLVVIFVPAVIAREEFVTAICIGIATIYLLVFYFITKSR